MTTQTTQRTIKVDGLNIFYREARSAEAPTLLLLRVANVSILRREHPADSSSRIIGTSHKMIYQYHRPIPIRQSNYI